MRPVHRLATPREADQAPVAEVVQNQRLRDQTICGWRKRDRTLEAIDVKRWRQLEQESTPLNKQVAQRVREPEVTSARAACRPAETVRSGPLSTSPTQPELTPHAPRRETRSRSSRPGGTAGRSIPGSAIRGSRSCWNARATP